MTFHGPPAASSFTVHASGGFRRGASLADPAVAMLKLTRLNKQTVVVNPDHIHAADATPDTTLRMSSGECLIVRETLDELIDQVVAFRRRVRHPFGASPTDRDASGVAPVTERHGHDASEISSKEGGR